jgi:hypothetical protein
MTFEVTVKMSQGGETVMLIEAPNAVSAAHRAQARILAGEACWEGDSGGVMSYLHAHVHEGE